MNTFNIVFSSFLLLLLHLALLLTVDKTPLFLELHGRKPDAAQMTFISKISMQLLALWQ